MRYDKDFDYFVSHHEWYTHKVGVGYVPTENAPKEAVEAIERFNKRMQEREALGYEE